MASRITPAVCILLVGLLPACIELEPSNGPVRPAAQRPANQMTPDDIRKLAEGGNAEARNRLGLLYSQGRGVPQSYIQAKEWFQRAADQGHPGAQVNLGTLYFLGQGAPESEQMALSWFRRAAAQGDPLAFAKLGLMYEQGRGVPQDYIEAHMWYNLSAAHGEKRAADSRDALASHMTSAQIAEAQRKAKDWEPKTR